jgi:hypothetical protein
MRHSASPFHSAQAMSRQPVTTAAYNVRIPSKEVAVSTPFTSFHLSLLCALLVAGCGGGGGSDGGGGSTPVGTPGISEVPFTSFAAVQPNQTVVMTGVSQAVSGTESSGTVTSATVSSPDASATSARLTYDTANAVSAMAINAPQFNATFTRDAGTLTCSTGSCRGDTATADAVVGNGPAMGWNYQTFGVWGSNSGANFTAGAGSFGSATPGNAVPTIGSATFTGVAMGFYVDMAGATHATSADMAANVTFSSRSIAFSTSNTLTSRSGIQNVAGGLNMTGSLAYSGGSSQFSGNVATANGLLVGTATGRFYGPNAEEIGGVYGLTSSGVSRMVGGFGGKR